MKNIYIGLFLFFILPSHALTDEITLEISKNWNQIKSMSGTFQQTDLEGNVVSGKFYFLKPYQSKFEYDNQPENIITNERLLRIVDSEGYQIDSYPIGNNIIKKSYLMRLISMKCLISGISKIILNFMNSTCSLIGKMRLVVQYYILIRIP